jgi:2-polyprenyl-3-methyl-5-hydroxy-6-metoxy-1,4-benzoquinol methylase
MVQSSRFATDFPETADIETASSDYARRFSGKTGKYFLDVQTRKTLDMLSSWPKARVLDVGGGHAQIAVPLVNKGYEVTVTGSSEKCRERLDMFLDSNSFTFKCCDMLNLPFEENSFDVVLAFRLLPHVTQWQKLIAEMSRIAKIAIVVDYPDIRSFNFVSEQLFKVKKAIEKNTRPFRCFNRREIFSEFKKNGFTAPTIQPEFFIPMVFHRAIKMVSFSKAIESCSCLLGLTYFFGSPVITRVVSKNKTAYT